MLTDWNIHNDHADKGDGAIEGNNTLGYCAVHFEEWQYESSQGMLGRIRKYDDGYYTASKFDDGNFENVTEYGADSWDTFNEAYSALEESLNRKPRRYGF